MEMCACTSIISKEESSFNKPTVGLTSAVAFKLHLHKGELECIVLV